MLIKFIEGLIVWWLLLGVPLSWTKGSYTRGSEPHKWIGIIYKIVDEGALMRLPPEYVRDLLALLEPACSLKGSLQLTDFDILIGKAGRVAHVVPAAKPFVAGLWGALAAVSAAVRSGSPVCRPGTIPCRRVCYSASWLRAWLTEDAGFH